jgi:hypothetical protein
MVLSSSKVRVGGRREPGSEKLKIKRRTPPISLIRSHQSGSVEAFQEARFSRVPLTDLFDAPVKVIAGPGTLGKGAEIGQQHHRPAVRVGLLFHAFEKLSQSATEAVLAHPQIRQSGSRFVDQKGPRPPICRHGLSKDAEGKQHPCLHEPQGQLLGQCADGKLVPYPQNRIRQHTKYATRAAAKRDLFISIEGQCNPMRRHLILDFVSPVQPERLSR